MRQSEFFLKTSMFKPLGPYSTSPTSRCTRAFRAQHQKTQMICTRDLEAFAPFVLWRPSIVTPSTVLVVADASVETVRRNVSIMGVRGLTIVRFVEHLMKQQIRATQTTSRYFAQHASSHTDSTRHSRIDNISLEDCNHQKTSVNIHPIMLRSIPLRTNGE